jgi:hypothetical protein
MGQYYKPIKLKDNKKTVESWMYSHDYSNGLKLMEHSWIGNDFVSSVENLLIKGGLWYNSPIVWAGDYAPEDKGFKTNHYMRCIESKKIKLMWVKNIGDEYRYIVNHTKKLFVDKTKVPVTTEYNGFEFKIHPLPLLTCEGNGNGGGDFYGNDEDKIIGSWARNRISIERTFPLGYKEIIFKLKE